MRVAAAASDASVRRMKAPFRLTQSMDAQSLAEGRRVSRLMRAKTKPPPREGRRFAVPAMASRQYTRAFGLMYSMSPVIVYSWTGR